MKKFEKITYDEEYGDEEKYHKPYGCGLEIRQYITKKYYDFLQNQEKKQ